MNNPQQPFNQQPVQKSNKLLWVILGIVIGGAVILIGVGVVLVIVFGFMGTKTSPMTTDKPKPLFTSSPTPGSAKSEDEKTSASPSKEDDEKGGNLKVSAAELTRDYAANEASADRKYKGKQLEVTGTATAVSKDVYDVTYVRLEGGDPNTLDDVWCYFGVSYDSYVSKIKEGQKLTARCTCDNQSAGTVTLVDCVPQN